MRRPLCTTIVEAWQRMREQYGDDVAQEAALHALRGTRNDQPGYLIYVAVKLAHSGFQDKRSHNTRRRVAERGIMLPYEATMSYGSLRMSAEDRLDMKRALERMSVAKIEVLQRVIDQGKTRGWRALAMREETLGGPELKIVTTVKLSPENEKRYRERYARGEYVPLSVKRKLGLGTKKARRSATI